MDAIEALKTRRSVRSYSDKAVDKKLICEVIDCARLAPTANNTQPWEFVVVTDREKRRAIARLATYGPFIADAPVCIVVLSKDSKYFLEDCSAATENILLAAHALGLGTCWVAGHKKDYCEAVKKLLSIPDNVIVISLISMGYPAERPSPHNKRALDEVLHWEAYT